MRLCRCRWIKGGAVASPADKSFTASEDVPALQFAQLKVLWSSAATLRQIFGLGETESLRDALDREFEPEPELEPSSSSWSFFGPARVGVAAGSQQQTGMFSPGGIVEACELYNGLCRFLPALKVDLLACFCFSLKPTPLIVSLWKRIHAEGGKYQHQLLSHAGDLSTDSLRPLLELFLQCGVYMFTILDDTEVFEKGFPFSVSELDQIAAFCNQLGFLMFWNSTGRRDEDTRLSCARLLSVLYERDSRRQFTQPERWSIADRKLAKEFEQEVMQESPRTLDIMRHMPYVLPFEKRVLLFRQWVEAEHARCAAVRFAFTIRRTHVIEDSLAALGNVDPSKFKSRWQVHFVNEQGLDEAGIDEQGLFREFVEISCQ